MVVFVFIFAENPCLFGLFVLGSQILVGLGMGLQLLLTVALQDFRILERLRLYVTKTWDTKQDAPWRVPRNFLSKSQQQSASSERTPSQRSSLTSSKREQGGGTLLETNAENAASTNNDHDSIFQSPHGSVRLLVSSSQAATSGLQMVVITIRPGCEMPSTRAVSLEVYQVLSGTGLVSQQGVTTTCTVAPGDLWVVDPGGMRWINNNNNNTVPAPLGRTDLVLLRTVDAKVAAYGKTSHPLNRIAMDSARRTLSALDQVGASVRRWGRMAGEYYNNNSSSRNNNNNSASSLRNSSSSSSAATK